jgi:hypothetical protein
MHLNVVLSPICYGREQSDGAGDHHEPNNIRNVLRRALEKRLVGHSPLPGFKALRVDMQCSKANKAGNDLGYTRYKQNNKLKGPGIHLCHS